MQSISQQCPNGLGYYETSLHTLDNQRREESSAARSRPHYDDGYSEEQAIGEQPWYGEEGLENIFENALGIQSRQDRQDDQPRRYEQRIRFYSLHTGNLTEKSRSTIPERISPIQDPLKRPFHRPEAPERAEPDPSQDVTDTSINDRTSTTEPDTGGNRSRFWILKEARKKVRQLATTIGYPKEKVDALMSSILESDWGGASGGVALSGSTDSPNKNDEQRGEDARTSGLEAYHLVRELTRKHKETRHRRSRPLQPSDTDQSAPKGPDPQSAAVARVRSRGGVLSNLLKSCGGQDGLNSENASLAPTSSSPRNCENKSDGPESEGRRALGSATTTSGASIPRREKFKWYKKDQGQSTSWTPPLQMMDTVFSARTPKQRRSRGGKLPRLEDEIHVTVHIAEVISRQRFLMMLCKSLMKYGAPTHRLEEYVQMTARVLEVDAQFLYLPGCMIMAFDDPSTRTTEVKLVRIGQGIDLGKLADTHDVYKSVVHDVIGVDEATRELEEIMNRKDKFPTWFAVFMYGVASATVGPFAFGARPIDMPISFLLGCIVGVMQLVIAPRSTLYTNVFEVFASVVNTFLARAIGSIRMGKVNGKQQYLFCFSGIAQSAIVLILPGFLVLCASLELQSHQIVAGSIRMVYAIIYSLFLGYGITVGTTIYGLMDSNANSNTTCPPSDIQNQYLQRFPFVVAMAFWLIVINKGKFRHAPVMVFIATTGYIVNYFSTRKIGSNSEVANTLGAFAIGVLGNLYSRIWHGHAATAILPGIFILVPSGLASSGTLISGVASADEIRGNVTGHNPHQSTSSSASVMSGANTSVWNLGFGMIQIAIGITVGLFLAALLIYPYGKRRSGLFSF